MSTLGAIVSMAFGMLVVQRILNTYGSDFNGLNATIMQIVNALLILEGGFILAVNFALYKPAVNDDQQKINQILAATKKVFSKLGIVFLVVGLGVSIVVPLVINTGIPMIHVFLMFIMALLPSAANIFFVMKYTCLFNVYQKDYIISFIALMAQLIIHALSFTIAFFGWNYLLIRGVHMTVLLANCVVITAVFKKKFPNANFKVVPDNSAIKGTREIFIGKLTGTLYNTLPIILISIFADTRLASVYAVYILVINAIKMIMQSVVSAPRNAFGQLIAEGNKQKLSRLFFKYNLVNLIFVAVLLSTTLILFMPFISLYTAGVYDVNYINLPMAILLVVIAFVELSHIPSGMLMFVGGYFKQIRNTQLIAAIVLVVSAFVGVLTLGIYGLFGAILLCAFLLALLEINFVHNELFNKRLKFFCLLIGLNLLLFIGLVATWNFINIEINTIGRFVMFGAIIFMSNAIVIVGINFIVFNRHMREIARMLLSMFKRKSNQNNTIEVGNMQFTKTKLDGVVEITPKAFGDNRGWFCEVYNKKVFDEAGVVYDFVQDNHSYSAQKGTVRALHLQNAPHAQSKLVRCVRGAIFDVAVDLRENSPTYKQWIGVELSAENKKMLMIPRGFAHGFVTLTDDTEVCYKVDNHYNKESEVGIIYNDPNIGIDWGVDEPVLSDKDKIAGLLKDANIIFEQTE